MDGASPGSQLPFFGAVLGATCFCSFSNSRSCLAAFFSAGPECGRFASTPTASITRSTPIPPVNCFKASTGSSAQQTNAKLGEIIELGADKSVVSALQENVKNTDEATRSLISAAHERLDVGALRDKQYNALRKAQDLAESKMGGATAGLDLGGLGGGLGLPGL